MSSFNGLDLFGSGPHRTYQGRRGQLITMDFFGGGTGGGSTAQGLMDFDVIIRGRLVSTSEAGLTALRTAILTEVQRTPLINATLVDTQGRTWNAMSFVTFTERGRRERGRVWSVRYEAVFRSL